MSSEQLTKIEPWPKEVLENAYAQIAGEWDALEEAATQAQGKLDFND
jgi:hypothetical protein